MQVDQEGVCRVVVKYRARAIPLFYVLPFVQYSWLLFVVDDADHVAGLVELPHGHYECWGAVLL